jgi:DNA-damage-inducible protein J
MFLKKSVQVRGISFSMVLPKEYKAEAGLLAMKEMSQSAKENGISDMTLDEINAEITAARNGLPE